MNRNDQQAPGTFNALRSVIMTCCIVGMVLCTPLLTHAAGPASSTGPMAGADARIRLADTVMQRAGTTPPATALSLPAVGAQPSGTSVAADGAGSRHETGRALGERLDPLVGMAVGLAVLLIGILAPVAQ